MEDIVLQKFIAFLLKFGLYKYAQIRIVNFINISIIQFRSVYIVALPPWNYGLGF